MDALNAAQRMQMIEKFETLTIKEYGVLVYENEQLRQRVAELEKQLESAYKTVDANWVSHQQLVKLTSERDALKQQRDELLAAIKKFLDENNPEGFGCACEPGRLCGPCSEAKRQRPLYAAIASVKEKQNGSD